MATESSRKMGGVDHEQYPVELLIQQGVAAWRDLKRTPAIEFILQIVINLLPLCYEEDLQNRSFRWVFLVLAE